MSSPTTRRDLRNEADWLPATLDDLVELRRRLLAAGQPPSLVSGLVGWLVAKKAAEPDLTHASTRSKYRRILAELAAVDGHGPLGGVRATAHNPRAVVMPARAA